MSTTTAVCPPSTAIGSPSISLASGVSVGDELVTLGWEINANLYRIVHAAARFDDSREWWRRGDRSASSWIATQLQVQTSTAAEWIRVGHALQYLPLIDAAFAAQEISYAKVRILTRWADDDNETRLLDLAHKRTAGRLTVAIAKFLADGDETDDERDSRLHDERSFTTWTDGDGMTVIRIALAPSVAKPVVAAVDELVRRIAETPTDEMTDPNATEQAAEGEGVDDDGFVTLSADRVDEHKVTDPTPNVTPAAGSATGRTTGSLPATLRELRRRWQPNTSDDWVFPSQGQQRTDAFDDGTPTTPSPTNSNHAAHPATEHATNTNNPTPADEPPRHARQRTEVAPVRRTGLLCGDAVAVAVESTVPGRASRSSPTSTHPARDTSHAPSSCCWPAPQQ